MLENLHILFAAGVFGVITTVVCIPFLRKIAQRYQIVDYPGGRRMHEKPTPLLGGVAVFLPFVLVFAWYCYLASQGKLQGPHPDTLQMVSLLVATVWILILGTIDDIFPLAWNKKLFGQLIGVGILVFGGHSVSRATLPVIGLVDFGWLGVPIFVLTVLTLTNAVNLIDGLDGIAAGICLLAALTSGIIGICKGDLFTAYFAFIVSGSLLGFLWYNFPPASIYLGDGGSLGLGFLLGTLATSCAAVTPGQRSGTMIMVAAPFLPFGIALLDILLAVLRRWITGRKIFLPDADHLHHRLMEKFGRPRAVVAIFLTFSAFLSALTLALVLGPKSRLLELFIGGAVLLLVAVAVAVLKLYRIENLSKALENRPHFRFVASYNEFMTAKIRRSKTLKELTTLLKTGVTDLGFDRVEVFSCGKTLGAWANDSRLHPEAARCHQERVFDDIGFIVRWVVPTHHSETYQKFLHLTWYGLLSEWGEKMRSFVPAPAVLQEPSAVVTRELGDQLESRR
jgi:UDP-GlcNAc:undecaprenyl-phosphate/decaprenyl-phosphate GlcNAc-1-phosphate transferase